MWIQFDEDDHRKPTPAFCLPNVQGKGVCLSDTYENGSSVLVFTGAADAQTLELLEGFASSLDQYRQQDAQVLALLPFDQVALVKMAQGDSRLASLPFSVLADANGQTRQAYTNLVAPGMVKETDTLIYLLDAYGAPYAAFAGDALAEVSLHEAALQWLQYISIQCPE